MSIYSTRKTIVNPRIADATNTTSYAVVEGFDEPRRHVMSDISYEGFNDWIGDYITAGSVAAEYFDNLCVNGEYEDKYLHERRDIVGAVMY